MRDQSIVFVNQATGYLTIDIINAFVRLGNFKRVALIAGSVRIQDTLLSEKVEWSKITTYNRGTPFNKLLSWLVGTAQIAWLLMIKYRKFEVFYVTVPPFAYLLSLLLPNRFSILVYDVYPDALQIYHISKRNWLHRLWSTINKRLFKKAYRLYTIGEGMKHLLQKYNTTNREIIVIPNWSGLLNLKEIAREENVFIRDQDLSNKVVVLYSGNIGYTHNVEVLVAIAEILREEQDIFFLIIGRGERYKHIQELVLNKQLMNCRVLPFQPDPLLNYTLSAADLAVVLLDEKIAHSSIPSKIYNIQAVGVPILGIADIDSELALHLSKYKNGITFPAKDAMQIAQFIKRFRADIDIQLQWRKNSRKASEEFTHLNANRYYETYQ